MTDEATPPPLAPRPPRPLVVHWAVDSAVAFAGLVVTVSFFGAPLLGIAATAVFLGAVAAPLTRRAEQRALARRDGNVGSG